MICDKYYTLSFLNNWIDSIIIIIVYNMSGSELNYKKIYINRTVWIACMWHACRYCYQNSLQSSSPQPCPSCSEKNHRHKKSIIQVQNESHTPHTHTAHTIPHHTHTHTHITPHHTHTSFWGWYCNADVRPDVTGSSLCLQLLLPSVAPRLEEDSSPVCCVELAKVGTMSAKKSGSFTE